MGAEVKMCKDCAHYYEENSLACDCCMCMEYWTPVIVTVQ
jgi:hypothetical protein